MTGELDIIGIYILGGVWLSTLAATSVSRRKGFRKGGIVLDAAQLLFYCLFYPVTKAVTVQWIFHLTMLAVAAAMFANVLYNCRYPFWDRVFTAFLVWGDGEFLGTVSWYIYYRMIHIQGSGTLTADGLYRIGMRALISSAAVFLVLFLIILALDHYLLNEDSLAMTPRRTVLFGILVLCCYLLSAEGELWVGFILATSDEGAIYLIRTMVDVCAVLVLYLCIFIIKSTNARTEALMLENILQSQYRNYQASRDSIEMVNQKYHDLKHQILLLKEETGSGRSADYLRQMEDELRSYEAGLNTGNHVLDVVLNSKLLQCQSSEIELKYMVNGELLQFMDDMDISALFGNIMDNAIECEEKIAQKDRRLIRMLVQRQKGFIRIFEENYCPDAPEFAGGLPVTTREDRSIHGYGMKSIASIVKKYGGSMSCAAEDDWFQVRILFPPEGAGEP